MRRIRVGQGLLFSGVLASVLVIGVVGTALVRAVATSPGGDHIAGPSESPSATPTTTPTSSPSPPPPPRGRVAYLSKEGAYFEIHNYDFGEGRARRVTNEPLYIDGTPQITWSPDGSSVFTGRGRKGGSTLIVVRLKTGEPELVTDLRGNRTLYSLDWAPDGETLAGFNPSGHLFILSLDDGSIRPLTHSGPLSGHVDPEWSPDGRFLAYACDCANRSGIYILDLASEESRRLTRGAHSYPSWSPDGSEIAYSSRRGHVFTVSVSSGEVRQLTKSGGYQPTWSPDGRYIAFVSSRLGKPHVYFMTKDGSNEKRMTHGNAAEEHPSWSPVP